MQDDRQDPIFARVRAACPLPPPTLAATVRARLPIRRNRVPGTAVAMAVAVAMAAAVVVVVRPSDAPHDNVAGDPSRNIVAGDPPRDVPGSSRLLDAGIADASVERPDALAVARAWVTALHDADADAAVKVAAASVVHVAVCAEGKARFDSPKRRFVEATGAKAVRALVACIAKTVQSPFFRPHWSVENHLMVKKLELTGLQADLALRTRLETLARDHELVSTRIEFDHHRVDFLVVAVRDGRVHAFLYNNAMIID